MMKRMGEDNYRMQVEEGMETDERKVTIDENREGRGMQE